MVYSDLMKKVMLCLGLSVMSMQVSAVPITDLYNTGVDDAGNALSAFVNDTHYTITSPGGFTAKTVIEDGFPIPPWVANNANSRWIGPANNNAYGPDGGLMTFSTTFTIDNSADLSTVLISGSGAADDTIFDVKINGLSLGSLFGGFTALSSFSINTGFTTGINTLDFIVLNSTGFGNQNPTGLRIDNISGSYDLAQSVAEPGVLVLMLFGLCFMVYKKGWLDIEAV